MDAPPRTDGRATDMRRRILEVARRRFAADGVAATSLRDIAEELGVTKAALYYHFPRKADLLHETLVPMADAVSAWLERAEGSDAPVRGLLEDYFDVVRQHHRLIQALGREPGALQGSPIADRLVGWIERAQRILAGTDADLEARVRATVAIGGLARAASFVAADDTDALRAIAVDAALDALQPPQDPSAPASTGRA
ncbi:TetR family transcriptional regulator [Nitriliruptor alkaliphilus]|uniref:TetR family transcriptional regulator n=1 Tax=Nitriliruptor alkaliphilus TaxID=427918 RepID=UPI0006965615|nr:TetR family transcriptional regulator [Nitriliruptor alkaliphilus]